MWLHTSSRPRTLLPRAPAVQIAQIWSNGQRPRPHRLRVAAVSAVAGKALQNTLRNCWSAALAASLLLGSPAAAEEVTISYPASPDPAIRAAQQTLVESWAYVSGYYVDHTFNGNDWKQLVQDALASSFKARDPSQVYDQLDELLGRLGDPFTRVLRQQDSAAFVAQEEGKVLSTGLGLLPDAQGQLRVSYVVEGSPAAGTRVAPGDILVSIDGTPVGGKPLSQVYQLLRKDADLQFQRPTTPDTPTSSNSDDSSNSSSSSGGEGGGGEVLQVHLQPAPLEFQSVQYAVLDGIQLKAATQASSSTTTGSNSSSSLAASRSSSSSSKRPVIYLRATSVGASQPPAAQDPSSSSDNSSGDATATHTTSTAPDATDSTSSSTGDAANAFSTATAITDTTSSSTSSSSSPAAPSCAPGAPCLGYLRIAAFSSTTPQLVGEALQQLGETGASGLLLDLRDNAGGLVEAGLEVVEDFLGQDAVLCQALGRDGTSEVVRLPEGHPLTQLPLVVLVNGRTASTSELVAGALRDEYGAILLGEPTYGKGRTQRVLPLTSGDLLLVSTAQYSTPKGDPVDKVGLQPGVRCVPEEEVGQQWQAGEVAGGSLLDDPCVLAAAQQLLAGAGRAAA